MASSKEVRAQLKKAKAAVDKKDFAEALNCCQAVFRLDGSSYHGHVFAGLSSLQLGNQQEARHHYQTAIALQLEGPLAWKGLADYYDKHSPTDHENTLEAVRTYSKLLGFIEGDPAKKQSTLEKLVALHKRLSQVSDVLSCYSAILEMCDAAKGEEEDGSGGEGGGKKSAQKWLEVVGYVLEVEPALMTEQAWEMLTQGFEVISSSSSISDGMKRETQVKYTQKIFSRFLSDPARREDLEQRVRQECGTLLEHSCTEALAILARLTLANAVSAIAEHTPPKLSSDEQQWLTQLHAATVSASSKEEEEEEKRVTSPSPEVEALGWAGHTLVSVAAGRWEEAKTSVDKAVAAASGGGACENWVLSAYIHSYRHDNSSVEQAAAKGLKALQKAPLFLSTQLEGCLKIYLAQANREDGHFKEAVSLLSDLAQARSHDYHVTVELVRTYLKQGDVAQAKELLGKLETSPLGGENSEVIAGLQGEVCFSQKDFSSAVERLDQALSHSSKSHAARHHFLKGLALWNMSGSGKAQAYSAFLQAAKGDPFNAEVFLHLGHYQKQVTGDLKRAIKCYQKAVSLQPSHTEASLALGNVLFATGEEEGAFNVYAKITTMVPKSKAKLAWLRMGLYQRKNKLYNDAIKSFQNALSGDPQDKHCWECLAEAYFARGSHISALRTFTKCLEFDPKSLYCLYQVASIKQLLGLLSEAVQEYSAALDIDPTYVPALKGRGESKLKLAQLSLTEVFDGKAVDYITSALKDLTTAAHFKPSFICLWKLIGDCCTCLHAVSPAIARPCVPKVLTGKDTKLQSSDNSEQVEKRELLLIGCRAYGHAIQLSPDSANLWHDLAIGYLYLGQALDGEDVSEQKEKFSTALKAIKKAVCLNQKGHAHWNSLGVIASCKGVGNFALAQHAFIRSLQEESNNPVAWTNLGVLYLKLDNIKLAHQAFKNAQALDPNQVQCWVGQALIAERVQPSEAMDLFRHSTELGYHPLGSAGYGYWVCQTLNSISPKLILNPGGITLNPIALRGTLQARDCLQKYVCREQGDACMYNLLGLLFEHEGLLTQAVQCFENAVKLCGNNDKLAHSLLLAKSNHARVQSALKLRSSEAVSELELLCQQDARNASTLKLELALALFREERLTESFQMYGRCLAQEEKVEQASAIQTAQAMVAFAQGDRETCKTLLFKAFQTPPPCLHGLVCLCALGCLGSDYTLMLAVLQEMEKNMEWQPDSVPLLHQSCVQALHTVSFLLPDRPEAAQCELVLTQILKRFSSQYSLHTKPESICTTLHRLSKAGLDDKSQLRSVVKLVHSYPSDVWCLSQLAALLPSSISVKYKQILLHLVESQLKVVSAKLKPSLHTALVSLQKWVAVDL